MTTPLVLRGEIRCIECRQLWRSTWNTQSPVVICAECGGMCLPIGPQLVPRDGDSAIDGEMFRLERRAVQRVRS